MSEQINGLFDSNLPLISPSLTDRILGENASQTGAMTLQTVKNLVRGTVSKTRAEMLSLISSSGLVVGERYYISDKGLVADAVATNAISSHVILLSDPSSIYYYDITNDVLGTGIKLSGWGEPKGGLLFDGVNDYVNILDNANLDFGDALGNDKPFSLEFFGYIQSGTTDRGIISKGNVTAREYALNIYSTNRIALALYSANSANRLSVYYPTALVSGWYHIVGTYDGSKTNSGLKLYLNGIPLTVANDNAGTYAGNDVNSGTISIGRWFSNGSGYYSGKAIIARIWNRVLSASEVISLYNNGLTGQNALPIADVGANTPYQSNFTTGIDNLTAVGTTATGNNDGVSDGSTTYDNVLKYYADNNNTTHRVDIPGTLRNIRIGKNYRIKFKYLIPSTNTTVKRIVVSNGITAINNTSIIATTLDAWTEHILDVNVMVDFTNIRIGLASATGTTFIGANSPTDDLAYLYDISITPLGCVAEYLPENAGDYSWYDSSGNRLHGEVVSTAGAGGASPLFRQLIQKATTGNFTTNIASGVASKVIYCPPGYSINSIAVRNTLASGNITDFQAVMAGVNLVTGKTINNAKSVIFKSIADHEISTSPQAITFTATGNGTGGIEISVAFFRRD